MTLDTRSFSAIGRRDIVALIALGLIAVGVPLGMSAAAGAIGVPSNDDWVYMIGATSLFRTGVIDMPGHTAASIGQLVMVQPLLWLSGGANWAFTAFGLAMGLVVVVSAYLLARRFVGTGSAVLAVAVVLAYPGLARHMATFMTDVPAWAFSTVCLLLGVRWLQGDGGRLTLIASTVTGILAVSIREFAVAAPAAILVAGWARNRPGERSLLAAATAALAAGIGLTLVLAGSLSSRGTLAASVSISLYSAPAFMTLAAALLPVLAVAVGRRIKDLQPVHLIAGSALVAMGMVAVPEGPFLGNIWTRSGVLGDSMLSGARDQVIAPRLWVLSEQLALFSSGLLAALILRWGWRRLYRVGSPPGVLAAALEVATSREGPLVLFLLAYAAELAVFGSLFPLLDRYFFPMIPPLAILLLRPFGSTAPARSLAFSHAALAWLIASALPLAANSFAYDAARWRAGEAAVAMGYAPQTVDAGYEWVGAHQARVDSAAAHSFGLTWYDDLLPSVRPCAVLSNSPLDKPRLALIRVDPSAYRQYILVGPEEPLFLYGFTDAGCSAQRTP